MTLKTYQNGFKIGDLLQENINGEYCLVMHIENDAQYIRIFWLNPKSSLDNSILIAYPENWFKSYES